MNRVDFAVLAAFQVVGAEIRMEERLVIATHVVVLDLEISVLENALRDDQIVWLVAAGPVDSRRVQAERKIDKQADRKDPTATRREPQTRRPVERAHSEQQAEKCYPDDYPPSGSGQDKEQRQTIGQPWQIGHGP